jgi:hypothetical protein
MRLLNTAAAVVAAAALAFGPARGEEASIRLPAEMCEGYFIVPVTFPSGADGAVTLRFLFDTGAEVSAVDPDALERVTGRRVRSGRPTRLPEATTGEVSLGRLWPIAAELDDAALFLGSGVDGILGFRAFKDYLLTLDYPAREMRVGAGALPSPDGRHVFSARAKRLGGRLEPRLGGWRVFSVPPPARDPRPWIEVRLGSDKRRMLIDSGAAGGALNVANLDDHSTAAPPRITETVMTMGGPRSARAARLDADGFLGPHRLERPMLSDTAGQRTELIGGQVMRHFAWTFDQRNRRVRIDRVGDEPIRFRPVTHFGLTFEPAGGGLRVQDVIPGSAAAEADIATDDIITHIDGVAVGDRGRCGDREEEAGAADEDRGGGTARIVRLTRRRGDSVAEIDLPLTVLVE